MEKVEAVNGAACAPAGLLRTRFEGLDEDDVGNPEECKEKHHQE